MAGQPLQKAANDQLTQVGEDDVFDTYLEERSVTRALKALKPRIGKISKAMFYKWLHDGEGRWERWQDNKKRLAHELTEETLTLADDAAGDPRSVPGARLQVETRRWIAERYNRQDYAKSPEVVMGVSIGGDFLAALKAVEQESGQVEEAEFQVIEEEKEKG